jgi:isochorismate hydrolase
MPIQITDAVEVPPIFAIIYGPPGVGKSTLLATMDTPYVLDFDRGYHRALWTPHRHVIASWDDVVSIITGRSDLDISQYRSLGIDTLGRALEVCADYVGQKNPKLITGSSLNQRGYGELFGEFKRLITWARKHSLPVIATAHETEGMDASDRRFFRPSMLGKKSMNEVIQIADLMGRLTLDDSDRRIIKLRSSQEMLSKDPAGLGAVLVRDNDPYFAAHFLDDVRRVMQERADVAKAKAEELRAFVDGIKENLGGVSTAEDFALLVSDITSELDGYDESTKSIVRTLVKRRADALALTYSKEAATWVSK